MGKTPKKIGLRRHSARAQGQGRPADQRDLPVRAEADATEWESLIPIMEMAPEGIAPTKIVAEMSKQKGKIIL